MLENKQKYFNCFKNPHFLSLFIAIILCTALSVRSSPCDTVSDLANDFKFIYPEYQQLNQLHLSRHFFVSEKEQAMSIEITETSVLKLNFIPVNAEIFVRVSKASSQQTLFETTSADLPIIFQSLDISPGTYSFTIMKLSDVTYEKPDEVCNEAYATIDIYIENASHFNIKVEHVVKQNQSIDDIETNFNEIIQNLVLQQNSNQAEFEDEESEIRLGEFVTKKVDLSNIKYYSEIGINVLEEFPITIPRIGENVERGFMAHINSIPNDPALSPLHFISVRLRIEMHFDYFLAGSLRFVLIRKDELSSEESIVEKLENLNCYFNGKCYVSKRLTKNSVLLNTVLNHGEYLLLIVNLNEDKEFNRNLKKLIGSVPVGIKTNITKLEGDHDNRFSCVGTKLPSKLNLEHSFKIDDNLIMDLENGKDTVEFYVFQNSLMRVVTFFHKGNAVKLELYKEENKGEFSNLLNSKNNDFKKEMTNLITKTISEHSKASDKETKKTEIKNHKDILKTVSDNFIESSGLLVPLDAKTRYKLVFIYDDAILEETESCETFQLKMEIKSLKYIKSILPNAYSACPYTKSQVNQKIDAFMKVFESNYKRRVVYNQVNDSSNSSSSDLNGDFENIDNDVYNDGIEEENFYLNSSDLLSGVFSTEFNIDKEIKLFVEIESEFTTSFFIPVITPVNPKSKLTASRLSFHDNKINMHLKPGKYQLSIIPGVNQYSKDKIVSSFSKFSDFNYLPKCMEFKIRMNSILINSKSFQEWNCLSENYTLPPTLMSLSKNISENTEFFSKSVLLPFNVMKTKIIPYKTKKHSDKTLLSVKAEVNYHTDYKKSFNVELYEIRSSQGNGNNSNSNKVLLEKATKKLVKKDILTNHKSINYILEGDKEYVLYYFISNSSYSNEIINNKKAMKAYFNQPQCPTYSLSVKLNNLNKDTFSSNEALCQNYFKFSNKNDINTITETEITPPIDQVIFNKEMNKSVYNAYKTEDQFFLNLSKFLKEGDNIKDSEKKKKELLGEEDYNDELEELLDDPEKNFHKGMFVYRKTKDKQFYKEYNFEVTGAVTKATLVIDSPYILTSTISAAIVSSNHEGTKNTFNVAKDLMSSSSSQEINGLLLTSGHYKLILTDTSYNKEINKEINSSHEMDHDICEVFKVILVLETKPFFNLRASENNRDNLEENGCPYSHLPNDLNLPGFIHYSSGNSVSIYDSFSFDETQTNSSNSTMDTKNITFNLSERSVFNLIIPEQYSENLMFSYIKLYRHKGNTKSMIFEMREDNFHSVYIILNKGDYRLKIIVKGVDDSNLFNQSCRIIEMFLTVSPESVFKNSEIPFELSNDSTSSISGNFICSINQQTPPYSDALVISQNDYVNHVNLNVVNKPLTNEGQYNNEEITIKINSIKSSKGRFVGEFNINPVYDTFFDIRVYQISEDDKAIYDQDINEYDEDDEYDDEMMDEYEIRMDKSMARKRRSKVSYDEIEINVEIVRIENAIWVLFITEPEREYHIKLFPYSYWNYSNSYSGNVSFGRLVCSTINFSAVFQALDDLEMEALVDSKKSSNSKERKTICKITNTFPTNFTRQKSLLAPFGGNQNPITGSLNFFGEFALPNRNYELRSEFFIREPSFVFINVIPKYETNNNINVEVYSMKSLMFKRGHMEINGIFTVKLESSNVPYFLNITFDKLRENCETFEFILDIVPVYVYENDYMNCDPTREKLPNVSLNEHLNTNNSNASSNANKSNFQEFFYTQFNLNKENKYFDSNYVQDTDGDYIRTLDFKLTNPAAITIALDHAVGDNLIEMGLIVKGNFDEIIEVSSDKFVKYPGEETQVIKDISINLMPGEYSILIIEKGIFLNELSFLYGEQNKKIEESTIRNFCFPFNLLFESVELKLTPDYRKKINDKYIISSKEIQDLSVKDVDMNGNSNILVAVEPASLKNIYLKTYFDIDLKFEFALNDQLNDSFSKSKKVYLVEKEKEFNRIYPKNIVLGGESEDPNVVNLQFSTASKFENSKCYKLVIEQPEGSFNKKTEGFVNDGLTHTYCTVNCDCNPYAKFKCGQNGQCICKHPYTGAKCNECEKGYQLSKKGKCVKSTILEKCDEKENCSGHGKCIKGKCVCSNGFESHSLTAINDKFCNMCSDPSKNYPLCYPENFETAEFNFNSPCNTYGPELPSVLSGNNAHFESMNQKDNQTSNLENIFEDNGVRYILESDGYLDFSGIFKFNKEEETMEIFAVEDSIIRVFYKSVDSNKSKILVMDSLEEGSIALGYSEGINSNESFITKLDGRDSPYYIKLMHKNIHYSCNRYLLKIMIRPINNVVNSLECPNTSDFKNPLTNLPAEHIALTGSELYLNKKFQLMDVLVTNKIYGNKKHKLKIKNYFNNENDDNEDKLSNLKVDRNYNQQGLLSSGHPNEAFEYNIKIEVSQKPITFYAAVNYDFLSNDVTLSLRDSSGKPISMGEWMVPDSPDKGNDLEEKLNESSQKDYAYDYDKDESISAYEHEKLNFFNYVTATLDPGTYFLTLTQNLGGNHLIQMIYDKSNDFKFIGNRCFEFSLHIQGTIIDKPDANLSTEKFESLYNRVLAVEPESKSNLNSDEKLQLFITFENKLKSSTKDPTTQSFKDAFYLVNSINSKDIIRPSKALLQGSNSRTFLVIFKKNSLKSDSCYTLNYDLTVLQTQNGDKAIVADKNVRHNYCTHNCSCNPFSNFECDENTKGAKGSSYSCDCISPYMGENCYECKKNYIMLGFKCLKESTCRKKQCNNHGNCEVNTTQRLTKNPFKEDSLKNGFSPVCACDDNYTGASCNKCLNPKKIYPDCYDYAAEVSEELELIESEDENSIYKKNKETILDLEKKRNKKSKHQMADEKDLLKTLKKEDYDLDEIEYDTDNANLVDRDEIVNDQIYNEKCDFSFVPHDFDSLGYLHLTGEMHMSGPFSLKQIAGRHFSSNFTIKEKTHVKFYFEHSSPSHVITLFLLNDKHELIQSGEVHYGPGGLSTSNFIDVVLDPLFSTDDIGNIKSNAYKHYELAIIIRTININEEVNTDFNDGELIEDCFNVFLEVEFTKSSSMTEIDSLSKCTAKIPSIIPDNLKFDYHTVFYENFSSSYQNYTFKRDSNIWDLRNTVYFHYEYLYVPDLLDKQIEIKVEIESKFLNEQIGLLLEVVEIPLKINKKVVNHKTLNSKALKEIFGDVKAPLCQRHCFTGIKKQSMVVLNQLLPSDTFFRLWFYDVSPTPQNTFVAEKHCVNFTTKLEINFLNSKKDSMLSNSSNYICEAKELPTDLNNKEYLGDRKYLKKWGFHLLDEFRIDHSLNYGLSHQMKFTIHYNYVMLRLVLLHGSRIETDLELYLDKGVNDQIMIAKSASKNFEEVILVDLPPGNYFILFKFFPEISGFHKCEKITVEFAMEDFIHIQENVDRMIARHKNKPQISKVDIYDHLKFGEEVFEKDMKPYVIPLDKAFNIETDDVDTYEPTTIISTISFAIDEANSNLVELYAVIRSDFLFLDAGLYLTDSNSLRTIVSQHKKNMNILQSGPLEQGTYVLTIRYYKRIHYSFETSHSQNLVKADFAELEFDAKFINLTSNEIRINTSEGEVVIKGRGRTSHTWFCRHSGLPIPKTLNNLRYIHFNQDSHIIDTFLAPTQLNLNTSIDKNNDNTEENENGNDSVNNHIERIRLKTSFVENTMIRIYIESLDIDVELSLWKVLANKKRQLVTISQENSHFETISDIVHSNYEYEIQIKFKFQNYQQKENTCVVFKMEIALETAHNYACPDSDKYMLLTDLDPVPIKLPVRNKKEDNKLMFYRYDSRDYYFGEDKGSGHVYMVRSKMDFQYYIQSFEVEEDIDLKVEISYDFVQAPTNAFLTHGYIESPDYKNTVRDYQTQNNETKSNNFVHYDSDIIAYGKLHENRSVLIIKNLPKGKYSLWAFLPSLKTRFENEPRVCSIYDVIVEAKKSSSIYLSNDNAYIEELIKDNISFPIPLPKSLNTPGYLEGETYLNLIEDFFIRKNKTNTYSSDKPKVVSNTVEFELKEESVVTAQVSHSSEIEEMDLAFNDNLSYTDKATALLKPGKHSLTVRLTNVDYKDSDLDSLNRAFVMFIGLASTKHYEKVLNYNKMQSYNPSCTTKAKNMIFDILVNSDKLDEQQAVTLKQQYKNSDNYLNMQLPLINDNDHVYYSFINDFINFNINDIKDRKIMSFDVELENNSRIFGELGGDLVISNLSIRVISGEKIYESIQVYNTQEIDLVVPPGKYVVEILHDHKPVLDSFTCLVFGLYLRIIDLEKSTEAARYMKKVNAFYSLDHNDAASKKLSSELLRPKCQIENILPLEISSNPNNNVHSRIINGEYNLHLGKTNYYHTHNHAKAKGKTATNLNQVDIKIDSLSLIRVSTLNDEATKDISIIPKMYIPITNETASSKISLKRKKLDYDVGLMSYNSQEHNYGWITDQKSLTLEFNEVTKQELPKDFCVYYNIDLLILPINSLVENLTCSSSSELKEYKLPNKKIVLDKQIDQKGKGSYHEYTKASYFSPYQLTENFVQTDSYVGIQYAIQIEIPEGPHEYNIKVELGYDHQVSIFDMYLSKEEDQKNTKAKTEVTPIYPNMPSYDNPDDHKDELFKYKVVSASEFIFNNEALIDDDQNKNDSSWKSLISSKKSGEVVFPYKRIINDNISPGKYTLLITESAFYDIYSRITEDDKYSSTELCLPFSYIIDIIPVDEKILPPEIFSLFPPADRVSFHSANEDIRLTVNLSKQPFTRRHHVITNNKHSKYILNSFYLTHKPTRQALKKENTDTTPDIKPNEEKIYPTFVEGNPGNKEWKLIFGAKHFTKHYDYILNFDNSWITDSNSRSFSLNPKYKSFPIFRIESKKEEIFGFFDSKIKDIKQEKEKTKETTETEINAEETKKAKEKHEKQKEEKKKEVHGKCGKHGKEVYDRVLAKWICSCLHGFTGKFCTDCLGKITSEVCIYDDEEDREDISYGEKVAGFIDLDEEYKTNKSKKNNANKSKDKTTNNSSSSNYSNYSSSSQNSKSEPTKINKNDDNNAKHCPSCIHGICDTSTGKCICEKDYKGEVCDIRFTGPVTINSGDHKYNSGNIIDGSAQGKYSFFFDAIYKLLIIIASIGGVYALLNCLKNSYKNNTKEPVGYDLLSGKELNEFSEMSEMQNVDDLELAVPNSINPDSDPDNKSIAEI